MAEKLTPQPDIEIIRDLLSPYLDDEVTDDERALVDAALTDSPELRDELESMQQTVALVADLPRVSAPRPFTLTEADVQAVALKSTKSFGLPAWFGGFAAAAALLVCVLAVGGLFWTNQFGSGGAVGDIAMAPQQAYEEPAAEEPAEEAPAEEEAPMEESSEAELLMEAVEVEKETAKEIIVEEKAEDAPNLASSAEATDTAGLSSDTDAARVAGEEKLESQALPTSTPAPLSTNMPPPSPTPALAAPAVPGVESDTAYEMDESAVAEGEAGTAEMSGDSAPDKQDDLAQKAEVQPTATAIALLTLLPPEKPTATPALPEPVKESQPETFPYRTLSLTVVIFILVIIIITAIGLVVRRFKK